MLKKLFTKIDKIFNKLWLLRLIAGFVLGYAWAYYFLVKVELTGLDIAILFIGMIIISAFATPF